MLSANDAYLHALNKVYDLGTLSAPRGMPIKELLGVQLVIDMYNPLVTLKDRKLNYRFLCGEAAWILSGQNDVASISNIMTKIAEFSDNGRAFNGAYGPRFLEQVWYAMHTLRNDPDSRQAVINIWRERPDPSMDIPCTLSWQFLIRNKALHIVATMRSSDLWLGLPYDIFNQAMLGTYIVLALDQNLKLGNIYLTLGSAHIYDRNREQVEALIKGNRATIDYAPVDTNAFIDPQDLVDALWVEALRGKDEAA